VEAALAGAARESAPFTLSVERLVHRSEFFRCLVLELAAPEPVLALRRRLGPPLGRRPEEAAWPHLSLLYAELPAAEREALCREVGQPARLQTPIRFDALALVAPRSDDTADWRDVAGWRRVGLFPLTAG
jgi:hypothetical protein